MNPHEQAYTYCAYCPKGCHFACPVSEATHSETTSTWGKMTATHLAQRAGRPFDEELSSAVHACTGCMRCTNACKHENEVAPALFAARGEAIAAGTQPKGAASTLATFAQAQNPFGVELGALVHGWRATAPVRHALFPGCSTLVKHPKLIEDLVIVSSAFGAPMGVSPVAARCCGYPLYAAGAHDAFAEHARSMAEALDAVPELVVLDPGCAFTLLKLYPRFGVQVKTQVKTVVEVLADNLAHAPPKQALPEEVGYHDACHLGRGLGQYDAPRALVRRAVERVVEAASARDEAGCSGGGGLLPRTMPEVALEVARREGVQVGGVDAAVVTACPTSRRMFERAGRKSYDLIGLLRRWLEQP
jgi:Fe-S oxidoreductase